MADSLEVIVDKDTAGLIGGDDTATPMSRVERVSTPYGMITATVEGDLKKPSIVTYHDEGLNHRSCFSGFLHHGAMAGVLRLFSVIHIDAPGQEDSAPDLSDTTTMTFESLTSQIDQVLEHFGKKCFLGFGVGAGGAILLNYAIHNPERMLGLVLCGVNASSPSVFSKLYDGVLGLFRRGDSIMQNLNHHYFSPITISRNQNLVEIIRRDQIRMKQRNVLLFMKACRSRPSLLKELPRIKCDVLFYVGRDDPDESDLLDTYSAFNPAVVSMVEVRECAALITEESPGDMVRPFHLYLAGLGYPVNPPTTVL